MGESGEERERVEDSGEERERVGESGEERERVGESGEEKREWGIVGKKGRKSGVSSALTSIVHTHAISQKINPCEFSLDLGTK